MRSPRVWAILAAVGLGLAIVGPFGVGAGLSPPGRFAYWFAIASGGYAAGLFVHGWVERALGLDGPAALRIGLAGTGTALAVLPLIVAANRVTFGIWPDPADWAVLAAQVVPLSLVVSLVFRLIEPPRGAAAPQAPARPALMDRLPPDKRGRLLALAAQDHYTEVVTEAGTALVLLRLADAIREAAPTAGLRVHRSHWVALDAAVAARREGDRAVLTLGTGAEIPVSRANMAAARRAGLLDGRAGGRR